MPNKEASNAAAGNSALKIWDTQYCSPNKAFTVFREGICNTFMPWSPEHKSGQPFDARIEGMVLDEGSAAHVVMTPLVAVRTNTNVADSPLHGIYGNFVLSGEACVEQGGRTAVAKRGDLILYETSKPLTMTSRGKLHYEDISFLFPRQCLSIDSAQEKKFHNVVLTQDRMLAALSSCLNYLAENIAVGCKAELIAVFDACVSLLPVAVGCDDRADDGEVSQLPCGAMLREIMEYVSHNISDVELSARRAAEHFGISPRYVHKLFAVSHTTFGSYVVAKRLEHIRSDLLSSSCRNQPISMLAYRWGFNDLSSFNRAFKNRFGCSPSRFRIQFGS